MIIVNEDICFMLLTFSAHYFVIKSRKNFLVNKMQIVVNLGKLYYNGSHLVLI